MKKYLTWPHGSRRTFIKWCFRCKIVWTFHIKELSKREKDRNNCYHKVKNKKNNINFENNENENISKMEEG